MPSKKCFPKGITEKIMDNSKIKIRRIEDHEIYLLVEYRMAYLAELQGKRDESYKKQLQVDLELYFKKVIAANRFFALLAEMDGKPVSFGGMVIKEIPGDFTKSSYLEGDILNMYTVPEARRLGISSMILNKLLMEAKAMGISKVALHTSKDGEKMYRNFGFSEPVYPYLELVINKENFTH